MFSFTNALQQRLERRNFLRQMVLGTAGVATGIAGATLGAAPAHAITAAGANDVSDATIFNFALNFEYLGSQYYLAALGQTPLPASLTGASGGLQLPSGSTLGAVQQQAATGYFALQLAAMMSSGARDHPFARSITAEGGTPISQPLINLNTVLVRHWRPAAGLLQFRPAARSTRYASEANFFVGAYVLEDVCVTALCGAACTASPTRTNLAYAAGILGVEGYQVGLIRSYLSEIGGDTATDAISNTARHPGRRHHAHRRAVNDVGNRRRPETRINFTNV